MNQNDGRITFKVPATWRTGTEYSKETYEKKRRLYDGKKRFVEAHGVIPYKHTVELSNMGCDLHMYPESFRDGKWESDDIWSPSRWMDEDGGEEIQVAYERQFYQGRYYLLFGVIAGVRNPTYQVCEPKLKIPDDCDHRIKNEYESWGINAHTPSYLTVKELEDVLSSVNAGIIVCEADHVEALNSVRLIIEEWIEKLKSYKGSDHRVVFWFDN